MRLLVLGGTGFVGPAVVAAAARCGWQVTLLNRGHADPPPGARSLRADRTRPGWTDVLGNAEFDLVLDTWSAAPRPVQDAASRLRGRAGRYAFISTRSVYAMPLGPGADESAPLVAGDPAETDGDDYARAKRGAELAVLDAFGDRALLVRAGTILGPGEDVGRLPYWLNRIAAGGRVLAPGPADAPLQYIDVRDLAQWTLTAAQQGLSGPYDLVSPSGHTTMRGLLESCVMVTGSDATLVWTAPEPILAAGIRPWIDLPVWLEPGAWHTSMHRSDVSKALAAGLRCRPVGATVADTWQWLRSIGGTAPRRADRKPLGLDPEIERRLVG